MEVIALSLSDIIYDVLYDNHGTATLYLTFPQNTTFTVITRPAFLAKVLLGLLWYNVGRMKRFINQPKNYGTFMCFESIFPGLS